MSALDLIPSAMDLRGLGGDCADSGSPRQAMAAKSFPGPGCDSPDPKYNNKGTGRQDGKPRDELAVCGCVSQGEGILCHWFPPVIGCGRRTPNIQIPPLPELFFFVTLLLQLRSTPHQDVRILLFLVYSESRNRPSFLDFLSSTETNV